MTGDVPVAGSTGVMTLAGLEGLRTDKGARLLEEAQRYTDPLLAVTDLRRRYPAELVAMAVELTDLRRRAEVKVADAGRMFFTREAMEQASDNRIARHRARRYEGFTAVADWGCGIGADTLALAEVTHAIGIDTDALRVEMARANAEALGRTDAEFLVADYLARPPDAPAVWADPARRVGGRRVTDPRHYMPTLQQIVAHAAGRPLGVKVSPAVRVESIPDEVEAEFLSVNGELKEAVFWYGDLRTDARRATVLPEGEKIVPRDVEIPPAPPGGVLYDPDPAVVRAGAVTDLGLLLGAWPMDPSIAYLSGEAPVATPFAQTLLIDAAMPWNLKEIKRHLRARNQRVEEVRKRGSAVDTETIRKALRGTGEMPVILVLTRVAGKPAALIAIRWRP